MWLATVAQPAARPTRFARLRPALALQRRLARTPRDPLRLALVFVNVQELLTLPIACKISCAQQPMQDQPSAHGVHAPTLPELPRRRLKAVFVRTKYVVWVSTVIAAPTAVLARAQRQTALILQALS